MSELSVGSLSGLAANSYVIDVASGSQLTQPGMILQVQSFTTSTATTTTSTTPVDTLCTHSITPKSASSQILVFVSGLTYRGGIAGSSVALQLFKGDAATGTDLTGDIIAMYTSDAQGYTIGQAFTFVDTPATTSSVTYTVTIRVSTSSVTGNFSGAQTITLIEVAG